VPRKRPSDDRLRRFAEEHLLYEAGMLYEVTGKLMNRHHEHDPVVQNALLESFGVHNRNLIDFLWLDHPMKHTDAIAHDWIERLAAAEDVGAPRARQGPRRQGEVHLSYNRLDVRQEEKGWTVLGIGPEVIAAFGKFATEAPDTGSRRAGEPARTPRPGRSHPST
jgi:hypothetical protein